MPTREHPDPHIFTAQQWAPWPVEIVFAFFAMPENLPRIQPKWQKARIEEASFTAPPKRPKSNIGLKSFVAGPNTKLTLSFRPFPLCPIRIPMRTRITEFTWNAEFYDQQYEGPFAYWNHSHRFTAQTQDGVSGTQIDDRIEYALPLGPLGVFANQLFVQRQLRSTFAHRHKATLQWLERAAAPYKSSAL